MVIGPAPTVVVGKPASGSVGVVVASVVGAVLATGAVGFLRIKNQYTNNRAMPIIIMVFVFMA
jgi:hypothetical protein